jgi:hypothetical protein
MWGNREWPSRPVPKAEKPGNSLRPTAMTGRHTAGPDASQCAVCVRQTTRCSVSRMLMRLEIAKCLISLTSLIPVIAITGNSKDEREAFSFARYPDADLVGGLAGIEPRPRRWGRARAGAALARYHTVNHPPKTFCPFCTRSCILQKAPLVFKSRWGKNFLQILRVIRRALVR